MFEIGKLMVYGTNGVCRVTDICPSPFDESDTRTYYKLEPTKGANLVIYTPVDNESVTMRELISANEAVGLLQSLPKLEPIVVPFDKKRREVYRDIIQTASPYEYLRLLKTVHLRRAEFRKTRRRLPDIDSDFEHTAREALYGELSVVLERTRDDINGEIMREFESEVKLPEIK